MDAKTVVLHADFPDRFWVVVEQPGDEPCRLEYDPATGSFQRTDIGSLIYARGFRGAYGWIGGLGAPPQPHFDVLLVTDGNPQAGEILLGHLCGMFRRGDGDHKFVALDDRLLGRVARPDLECLDPGWRTQLLGLYPRIGPGEGWFGAWPARAYLAVHPPDHD